MGRSKQQAGVITTNRNATPRGTKNIVQHRETPCNAEIRNTVQRREENTVQHEIKGTCVAVQRRSERFARLKVTQESNGCCAGKHRQHVRFERSATQKTSTLRNRKIGDKHECISHCTVLLHKYIPLQRRHCKIPPSKTLS